MDVFYTCFNGIIIIKKIMQTFKFTWILVVTVYFDSGCQVFIYVLTVFFVENGGFQPTFFFPGCVSDRLHS